MAGEGRAVRGHIATQSTAGSGQAVAHPSGDDMSPERYANQFSTLSPRYSPELPDIGGNQRYIHGIGMGGDKQVGRTNRLTGCFKSRTDAAVSHICWHIERP
jgi:hypothetical protein